MDRKLLIKLAVFVVVVGGTMLTLHQLKKRVETKYALPAVPPNVVLVNKPVWMSEYLASRIAAAAKPKTAASAFDHDLLVSVAKSLQSDPSIAPWIEKVKQVKRTFVKSPGDTIEVDCVYRAPVALVHFGDDFWLVDGKGTKLPEKFTSEQVPKVAIGPNGKLVIRMIEGVREQPDEAGKKWPGEDLAAGLEMAKLLYTQAFSSEIVKIDVSNFAFHDDERQVQIKLITRYGTEIRWGAPPSNNAFDVPVARKLIVLSKIRQQYGRVDAHKPWLDIHLDKVTFPAPQAETASTDPSGQ